MPGHQKGDDIIDDESVGHGLAGGGVACRHEAASSSSRCSALFRAFTRTRMAMSRIVRPARVMARDPGCGIHGGKPSEVSAIFQTE